MVRRDDREGLGEWSGDGDRSVGAAVEKTFGVAAASLAVDADREALPARLLDDFGQKVAHLWPVLSVIAYNSAPR